MANEYRVSWYGFETYHVGSASARVTCFGIETVHAGSALARISTFALEAAHAGSAQARVSTLGLEVVHAGSASARVSSHVIEVFRSLDLPERYPPRPRWIPDKYEEPDDFQTRKFTRGPVRGLPPVAPSGVGRRSRARYDEVDDELPPALRRINFRNATFISSTINRPWLFAVA